MNSHIIEFYFFQAPGEGADRGEDEEGGGDHGDGREAPGGVRGQVNKFILIIIREISVIFFLNFFPRLQQALEELRSVYDKQMQQNRDDFAKLYDDRVNE